jgi:alkanesulfonate monooxygenase SsuD/methylene tetrahydromethanopterin reductase-like flavin-dependent oxidoreductase (luciferase family)
VQTLYLDGKREEAYNAIPDEIVDVVALIGTEEEVAERLDRFAKAGIDRLIISPFHSGADQARHTIQRIAALAGAAAPA